MAVLIKYNEEGAERCLVLWSAYLPSDSEDPPPSKELEDLVCFCEKENLYLLWSATPMHTQCMGQY